MEIGDLFYLVLLVLFMILGFFNDSQKKKEQQKSTSQTYSDYQEEDLPETPPPPVSGQLGKKYALQREEDARQSEKRGKEENAKKNHKVLFQSSMEQVTDFAKESSLKNSISMYDSGSLYDQEPESPDMPEVPDENNVTIHPLVEDLLGGERREELIKGLIYGEIMQRKY